MKLIGLLQRNLTKERKKKPTDDGYISCRTDEDAKKTSDYESGRSTFTFSFLFEAERRFRQTLLVLMQKFYPLLWKNTLFLRASKKTVLRTCFFAIMFAALPVFLKISTSPGSPGTPAQLPSSLQIPPFGPRVTLGLSVDNLPSSPQLYPPLLKKLMGNLQSSGMELKYFCNVTDMDAAYQRRNISAGVVFHYNFSLQSLTNQSIKYTLKSGTNSISNAALSSPSSVTSNPFFPTFVSIQNTLELAIVNTFSNKTISTPLYLRSFPTSASKTGPSSLTKMLSLYLTLVLVFTLSSLVLVDVAKEKECKVKELFFTAGVTEAAYVSSWFAYALIILGTVSVGVNILYCVFGVFPSNNILLPMLVLFEYCLSLIAAMFFVVSVTSTQREATAAYALLIMLATVVSSEITLPAATLKWLIFLPPVPFALTLELVMSGAPTTADGAVSLTFCLLMMVLNTFLYTALSWYFGNLLTPENTLRRHPLFCLKPSFWFPSGRTAAPLEAPLLQEEEGADAGSCTSEPVSPALANRKALQISSLQKHFVSADGGVVKAVDGLSLDMYEGQITCLLGHNGAGKTTAISMLTGLTPPSGGDATVYGYSLQQELDSVRSIIGSCMQ